MTCNIKAFNIITISEPLIGREVIKLGGHRVYCVFCGWYDVLSVGMGYLNQTNWAINTDQLIGCH